MLGFCVATLASLLVGLWKNIDLLFLIPGGLLVAWLAVVDFRKVYFLMLAAIPFSVEFSIGSFGTDLPSEPLMWVLFGGSLLWFWQNWRSLDGRFFKHPISLMLFLHLSWLIVSVAASQDFMVSFKFLLAKTWYVVVFYFLAGHFLDSEKNFRAMVWAFFVPLLITVLSVLARHAPDGFSFDTVNYVMGPFYRNHVMYACVLAIFLPFVWYATYWYRRWSWQWNLLVFGILTLIVGIQFAYTRAAYLALVAAVLIYWVVRARAMKMALTAAALSITIFIGWITSGDNYLMFAPDYEHTVTHKSFDDLLEATTKLEDISVMERVYRWVAAAYMIEDRPFLGFGPGNFYFFYRNYTVNNFTTYVSNNPEKSGIHCYYLMTAVEQGVPGSLIFMTLCGFVMIYGEGVYHRTKDVSRRRFLVASLLSFVLIDILMLMNDFVETDKIGSLFFVCMAVLVNIDLKNRDVP